VKQQVPQLYSDYGRYINGFRAFPLIHDGLKIVERRLLYSLFQIAKEHYTKSAKVVGHCIGNYHPHGDVSTYMALVAMVHGGLAEGQGNWGTDIGVTDCEAAAQRYTEVRSSKEILKMAFEYIKYVDYEALELDEEPVYLPSKLPICLINLNGCQGIGFGSRTVIPTYKSTDLIKRLRWLLNGKKGIEPVIKPITKCTELSQEEEFKKLLTTGVAKLDYEGVTETDVHNKAVIIKSLPPGKTFDKILNQLENEIQIEKALGWTDETSGSTGTRVRFTILRQRGYQLETLVKKMKKLVAGSVTFECNMCDRKGNVILVSVDQMLLNVYNMYKSVIERYLKITINELQAKIDEMELIRRIKVVLPKHLQQHPDDPDSVISLISSETTIAIDIIKQLFEKYNINRLLKVKTDIESVQEEKQQFINNLNNLEQYVWSQKYAV